jgi:hypothetical protein
MPPIDPCCSFYLVWCGLVHALVLLHTPLSSFDSICISKKGAAWALGIPDAIPVATVFCLFYLLYASYLHLLATIFGREFRELHDMVHTGGLGLG